LNVQVAWAEVSERGVCRHKRGFKYHIICMPLEAPFHNIYNTTVDYYYCEEVSSAGKQLEDGRTTAL
jgi:hypothetical protein